MKILTVEEAINNIKAKSNKNGDSITNRFNKKNFNMLMVALMNDLDFKSEVMKKVGDKTEPEDIMVTKEFRKWCKKLVEKAGVDSKESQRVLTSDFQIDNVEGLYDFFTSAIYEYLKAGNRFDFPNRKDFSGGFILKDVKASKKKYKARNPKDGSILGEYETSKKPHKLLVAKSSCPSYLTTKTKLS